MTVFDFVPSTIPFPVRGQVLMEIDDLRYFMAVASRGSVSGAAHDLGVSRSLVRRRIEALETVVGAQLLHSDVHGVQLTGVGVGVIEKAQKLVSAADALVAEAQEAARVGSGCIRVIEPCGLPVAARAQALLATHASVPKIDLVVRTVENPLQHLNEPCELVLHDGPAPDSAVWFSRVLMRAPIRVVASPRYLAARGRPTSVEALSEHDLLAWRHGANPADEWPLLAGGTARISPWLTSTDLALLRAVAASGGGLLLTPISPLLEEAGVEPLEVVLSDLIGGDLPLRASSRLPSRADAGTRKVLEQMEEFLRAFPAT